MSKLSIVTIDRRRWLRGEGTTASKLLRTSDGKKCCLGFLALVCGLNETEIQNVGGLSGLHRPSKWINLPGMSSEFINLNTMISKTIEAMYGLNDDLDTSDEHKETELNNVAQKVGFQFKFIH